MFLSVPTPHIVANPGDFAKTVLMPGDPKRSRFIADEFLSEARLVNDIRGVQGYTGLWKGVPVSVMASGMGMPSMAIYSHELYNGYEVENIIRVGSAGGIAPDLHLRDLVAGMSAHTNSSFGAQYRLPGTPAPTASYPLLKLADKAAAAHGINLTVGTLYSTDTFYDDDPEALAKWRAIGALAVEMEAAALYLNAQRSGKNALCLCTISDLPLTGEQLSPADRATTFTEMIQVALDTAVLASEGGR